MLHTLIGKDVECSMTFILFNNKSNSEKLLIKHTYEAAPLQAPWGSYTLCDFCTPYNSDMWSYVVCVCVCACVVLYPLYWWLCLWTTDPSSFSAVLSQPACSTPLIRVASSDRNAVTICLLTNGTCLFVTPVWKKCEKPKRWHILTISVHLIPFLSFPFRK